MHQRKKLYLKNSRILNSKFKKMAIQYLQGYRSIISEQISRREKRIVKTQPNIFLRSNNYSTKFCFNQHNQTKLINLNQLSKHNLT